MNETGDQGNSAGASAVPRSVALPDARPTERRTGLPGEERSLTERTATRAFLALGAYAVQDLRDPTASPGRCSAGAPCDSR